MKPLTFLSSSSSVCFIQELVGRIQVRLKSRAACFFHATMM